MNAPAEELTRSYDAPGGPKAVLCLHGFTSSPYEMRLLCEALTEAGHRVRAPRLVGHGTRAETLRHTRWEDWLAAARRAFDDLVATHGQVFIVGLSLGSLLALAVAHQRGERVAGVVAMGTPLKLTLKAQTVLRIAEATPLGDVWPFIGKKGGADVSDPAVAVAMPSYDKFPLTAAASMLEGQRVVSRNAAMLSAPVLVQHGRFDHIAPVSNAKALMRRLRTPNRRLIEYPRSWHVLPLDVEHEAVIADVLAFIDDPKAMTASGC